MRSAKYLRGRRQRPLRRGEAATAHASAVARPKV
jgi:hypothetical protein